MSDLSGGGPGITELQAEIDQTREALARTVDQLAAKADVKARVKARAGRPGALVIVAGAAVAVVALLVWRRSRRSR